MLNRLGNFINFCGFIRKPELYLCRHSLVVIVLVNMSKQIGQVNSLWRLRAETAISVSSVMASCGVRWSSYKERSHDRSTGSLAVIIFKFLLWFHEFPKIFPKTLISLFRTSYLAFFQSAFNFSYDFLETYLNLNDRSKKSLVVIIEPII